MQSLALQKTHFLESEWLRLRKFLLHGSTQAVKDHAMKTMLRIEKELHARKEKLEAHHRYKAYAAHLRASGDFEMAMLIEAVCPDQLSVEDCCGAPVNGKCPHAVCD